MATLLNGKTAVITGAARGIGKGIALSFAENGASVALLDRCGDELRQAAEEVGAYGHGANSYVVDVSKVNEIRQACGKVIEDFGQIDIWVNNAGVSQDKPILEIDEADWDRILATDLKAVFFCSQIVFEHMKKRRAGKLINIASLAGERGGRFAGAHYSAAKAGVIVLTKCFALEGGQYSISVNAVSPGLILTQMAEDLGWTKRSHDIPLGRLGAPNDVGMACLFLASSLSDYITGQTIDVNGGMFMP